MSKHIKLALFMGPIDYSLCFANALAKHCSVTFFYDERGPKQQNLSIPELLNDSVKKVPINTFRIRDPRNMLSYYKVAKTLNHFDIVHVQSGNVWLSLFRRLFKRIPIVFTIHDPHQHVGTNKSNYIYQDISQKLMSLQSSVSIVHGRKLKKMTASKYGVDPMRIEIVPHGELSFYKKLRKANNPFSNNPSCKRVLFFGEARKNKGIKYLIDAEPIISKHYNDYKICIAGSCKDLDVLNCLEKVRNNQNFEIIDRYVPIDQVADLVESSYLVVLPYISATQSGVLSLAFGFGKTVVSTDTGSIGEIIEHEKTGLIVPPCNEKALADAILKLLKDEDKCKLYGENAKKVAEQILNWDTITYKIVNIYNYLVIK